MADNLEYDNSSITESNASFGNNTICTGMSSALYTEKLRGKHVNAYNFKNKRPISAPPVEQMVFNDITVDEINKFLIDLIIFSKKMNPFNTIEEKDLCFEMSKDQDGSRFIQKRLEISTDLEKIWFYRQTRHRAVELSLDLFGNYIIHKFLSMGDVHTPTSNSPKSNTYLVKDVGPGSLYNVSADNPSLNDRAECVQSFKPQMLDQLKGNIRRLSYDVYGCRVIQKLLEVVDFDIRAEFEGHVIHMVRDQNGNHVIQKCIESSREIRFILKDFEENACEMAKHTYGCRAIQRLFENCGEYDCLLIINKILESSEEMIFDQYKNYVIQHILEFGRKEFRDAIFQIVIKDVYGISIHKFASNVMEKCVLVVDNVQKKDLIAELLVQRKQKPLLLSMCLNNLANYVVQWLIDSVDVKDKQRIRDALKPYFGELKRSVYSKQILNKIC